ncbi:MAG: transcriptional repressor [Mycobacteriaceae bacterium]|nr:transcriptional repressor [Mycobacteriaceae bacterium]MBV9638523.1 transcriptional repressor [Mycobacteriaceae bacterium]
MAAGQQPSADAHNAERQHRMRALLRQHGLRCTGPRLAVLEELDAGAGHLSVGQIHARLRQRGHAVDLATVYRTVSTMVELGVVHALAVDERSTTYGLVDEPHHHAVCTGCGSIMEIPAQQLSAALTQASEGSQFSLSEQAGLTLHGVCPNCQRTQTG